ncbi:MAG: hypothetical protein K0Q79_667 [Flavipsychrobacter sp.]|jgi:hypothetical protein|nr:hypothetical protein [Flavipsychrobacter sp.]
MKIPLLYIFTAILVWSCNAPAADTKKGPAITGSHAGTVQAVAQPQNSSVQEGEAQAYTKAIAEYIKEVYTKGKQLPDTLFIGRNIDFPDITLPATIEQARIVLLTSEEAQQKLAYRKTLVYLNVMGWIEKDKAEFLIVRFNEFKPQHNCHIYFERSEGMLVLDSLGFNYPYGKPQKREGDFHH